jgi:hypothetical protein
MPETIIFMGYPFEDSDKESHRFINALVFMASSVSLESGPYVFETGEGKDDTFRRVVYNLPAERKEFEVELVSGKFQRMRITFHPDIRREWPTPDLYSHFAVLQWDNEKSKTLKEICDILESYFISPDFQIRWNNDLRVGLAGPFLALIMYNQPVAYRTVPMGKIEFCAARTSKAHEDGRFVGKPWVVMHNYLRPTREEEEQENEKTN